MEVGGWRVHTYHDDGLDVVAREAERVLQVVAVRGRAAVHGGRLRLGEEGEHVVDHVGVGVVGALAALHVLVDDLVDEAVQRGAGGAEAAVDPLQVHPPQPRQEVADVEGAEQLGELLQDGDELLLVLAVAGAERGPERHVLGQGEDELAQVHRLLAAGRRHGADQRRALVAHGHPRLGAPPAEELHHAQLPHLAPEGPVVRERHVRAVVRQVRDGDGRRAVREHAVMRLQHLARVLGRGHGERVQPAKAEVEQPAVLVGQRRQAAVGQLVHHRHVAHDRQRLRARRQRRFAPSTELQEHHGQRDQEHTAQRVLEPLHGDLGNGRHDRSAAHPSFSFLSFGF